MYAPVANPNTSFPGPVPDTSRPIFVPAGTPSSSANGTDAAWTSLTFGACAAGDAVVVPGEFDAAVFLLLLPLEHAPASRTTAMAATATRVIVLLRLMCIIGFRPLSR